MGSIGTDSMSFSLGRRLVGTAACVVALVVLSACSGGSKSTSNEQSGKAISESTTKASKSKDIPLSLDGVAQYLSSADLGCNDFLAKVDDPTKTKTTLAPEPVSAMGSCTVEGTHLTMTIFGSKTDEAMAMAQLKTIYAAVAKSLGITQLTYVHAGQDDRIWFSIAKESGGDKGVTPAQQLLLNKVAKALNGKVVKVDL